MNPVSGTMRAAVLSSFGGPEQFSVQEVPRPSPEPDEILIRVHTAGVGVWDSSEREGKLAKWIEGGPEFPYILGSDGSGTVVATGTEVRGIQEGDTVYAAAFLNPKGGFYAEYTAVKAENAAPIPDGLSMEEAGALPVDGVTALRGLRDQLQLQEGETLLVFGASGGVGHLAVQLAHRMGARVLAVASGSDGVDRVEELDASEVVDGHGDGFDEALARLAPNGLDAALVTAAGDSLDMALAGLRNGSRLAWPNGVRPPPNPPPGVEANSYDGRPDPDILKELNRLIDSGPFKVHIAETFPLTAAADAHRALGRHYVGKLAIRVGT
jgi:NADPH:quinone reductase